MNRWLFIGAINGFLAVAVGAFGAHGLEGRASAHELAVFATAAQYHLIHALAIVAASFAARGQARASAQLAAAAFLAGIVCFSGSLYFLVLAHSLALVLVTPLGGVFFLAGWAILAIAALKPDA